MLNIADSSVVQMAVIDCGEPLVTLVSLHPRLKVDDSIANREHLGYPPQFLVRVTPARMLVQALEWLPDDLHLLVKESLRPAAIQEMFFARRMARLSVAHPALSQGELIELTARFIAPPSVGGHPSGGAIDITLCDMDKHELDLGCAYDQDEETSGGRCLSACSTLSVDADRNRALLFSVLKRAGFVNYPFEWWHWSYGDRYWAVVTGKAHAIYGPAVLE